MCNYLRRMRALRARLGLPELKSAYTTEVTHGERGTRYHHHLIVNGGISREAAEGLWRAGNVNSRAARPDGYGLSAWAHHMSKSREVQQKAGAHGFACSRNLKKPLITHADRKLSVKGVQRLAERRLETVDDHRLLNLAKAMREMTGVMRNLYDIQTASEREQLAMAREKLEIEREKLARGDAQDTQVEIVMGEETREYVG